MPAEPTSHLMLRDVCFAYPSGKQVLDGINLSVPHGATWSIVGPNGSGKSTLLRVMAGLLTPNRGEVLLSGRSLSSIRSRDRARRIAFLPQNVAPAFGYVARQVVAMGRYPHVSGFGLESQRDWQLVDQAMASTDTSDLASRTLNTLSGGERQRVLIAAAFVQASDLLLLDEPTTALDVNHQIKIYQLLVRIGRTGSVTPDRGAPRAAEDDSSVIDDAIGKPGCTVVTVTHDLNLAAHFSQHIVMMKDGRVVAAGPSAEVLTCERVEAVYGVGMHSLEHPSTGAPVLVPAELTADDEGTADGDRA